jgi:hypothetical protein
MKVKVREYVEVEYGDGVLLRSTEYRKDAAQTSKKQEAKRS